MRRTCLKTAKCPVARSLDVVGDWWTLLIVREALKGARRFGEFQKALGLAKNILSTRLREMAAAGILEVRPAEDGGAHSEYHLTEAGARLQIVLVALRQWAEESLYAAGEPMTVMVDKEKGEPVQRLRLLAKDGRPLEPGDTTVKDGRASASKRSARPPAPHAS